MDYQLAVYGDSIAFGYANQNRSWFDDLSAGAIFLKLAQNGEKIADVLNKIKKDTRHYETLILAVGINDLLQPSPTKENVSVSSLIAQYSEVLKAALNRAENVIIQSVLPVREELFPEQEWLEDERWVYNENIIKFNKALNELCKCCQASYLDAYSEFCALSLPDVYADAVHLNESGQQKLFEIYKNFVCNL